LHILVKKKAEIGLAEGSAPTPPKERRGRERKERGGQCMVWEWGERGEGRGGEG
jgi:hypothetical protein